MKQLEIKNPCSEDWSRMTGTEKKRFCASCQHDVEDFTDKSVEDIIHYLKNKEGRTCGRLNKSQLNPIRKIAAAVMIGGMLAGSCTSEADHLNLDIGKISLVEEVKAERTKIRVKVEGTVYLENGEKVEGAEVTIRAPHGRSSSNLRISTNADGTFKYEEEINADEFDDSFFEVSYKSYKTYYSDLYQINMKKDIEIEIENHAIIDDIDLEGEIMGFVNMPMFEGSFEDFNKTTLDLDNHECFPQNISPFSPNAEKENNL